MGNEGGSLHRGHINPLCIAPILLDVSKDDTTTMRELAYKV